MAEKNIQISMPQMCDRHQQLLVHQAGYSEKDPWRALIVVTQIALFQATTCDPKTAVRIGGDVSRLSELGCLACNKPDSFGEIVEAAKSRDLGDIKALGEKWINEAGAQGQGNDHGDEG